MIDPAAQARLERWKLSLLDLSAANRLIDVKDVKTTIPLPSVDVVAVAAALSGGAAFTVESGPPGELRKRTLRSPLAGPELARRLVAIRRAARSQLADGGVHTLWLGLGMLVWRELAGDASAWETKRSSLVRADGDDDGGAAPDGAAAADTAAAPEPAAAVEPAVLPGRHERAAAGGAEGAERTGAAGAEDAGAAGAEDAAVAEVGDAGAEGAESDDAAWVTRRSPLVLWPVELVREPGGGLRLVEATGVEPRCNQTLREKLRRELGLLLPGGDAAVRGAATDREEAAVAGAGAAGAASGGTKAARAASGGVATKSGGTVAGTATARGAAGGDAAGAAGGDAAGAAGGDAAGDGDADSNAGGGGGDADGDGDAELDLERLLAEVEALVAGRPGWSVERSAALGIFGFAKFVMWNDLDARADELIAGGVVAHLAAGAGTAFVQPSPEAEQAVAGEAPITELIAPLDADASQLAAVAAASAGASFVLQGPPGTGKSQTIANLIAHSVASGRTVLFVTDKMAALDVVHQRLAAIGLGDACLALHSHRAVRAQVMAQLGRVLERAFRPVAGAGLGDARLGELRAALDDHAAAMHRVGPFGRSLHQVLGRLVELRSTARAALAERDATGLDAAGFERRRLAVEALGAAAAAVEPVAAHPWRASTLERWPLDGRERVRGALDEVAGAASELAAAVREVEQLVPGVVGRTREQLSALGALATLAAASQRPGAELLTQLRGGRGEDVVERIALLRARGGAGVTVDVPREPGELLVLASRHRMLAFEVNDRFTDSVAELDAPALWAQVKRWMHRLAPLRYMALRQARAAVAAAAMPGMLETDGAIVTALEAVIAERAARAALAAAAEPARRWFGELGGDPLTLDLKKIDAAVTWAADLRLAFDAIEVAGGATGRAAAWRTLVAQVAASPAGAAASTSDGSASSELAAFARLGSATGRWRAALAAVAEATGIDERALGAGGDHLEVLADQIALLHGAIDGLRDWVAFHAARRAAQAAGTAPALLAIERGDLGAGELAAAWERATLLAWADAELAHTPALEQFHGATHHGRVASFADLDRASLTLIRARALIGLAERVPRVTGEPGGELGTLLHEVKKQRGHRPLRRLFAEIPALLPRLAPCMLMSPLSVAQYLDPALPRFDLVVFDEASQLPTADAIGALARGRAAVVVGDSRQLPPTRFFEASGGDGDDGDEVPAASETGRRDLESILDDCVAARLPERSLTWHYRSRHEDLIAFSNRRYYGDRLQVLPAAHGSPDLGVVWRRVDGIYDRGGTRQNRVEAEAVAAEVIARLGDPAQRTRSIGVVTFSRAQQDLIEDLLDDARAAAPELDGWFDGTDGREPVLVKNLETIQGDERDVVIISVGYGPDAGGRFTRNLGPLSQRGGERRLNVAITRARQQLLVFSSFAPEDLGDDLGGAPGIDGDAAMPVGPGGQGVRDLAALLAFARDGGSAARPATAGAPPASPITAAIGRALVERGWTVRHQVGCGAYKIDLAVVDPNEPDRYVMAIEHDGDAYASAPAARDRDRLRAQVLGDLGWRVHRIWSLDWWTDPEREIQRAHGAITVALAASRQRRQSASPPPVRAEETLQRSPRPAGVAGRSERSLSGAREARPTARSRSGTQETLALGRADRSAPPARARDAAADPRPATAGSGPTEAVAALVRDVGSSSGRAMASGSAPVKLARNAIAIGPYVAASVPAGRRVPDDLFAPRHLGEVGKIIEQVLAAEAPVHLDVLARRVGAYFGIGRLTQRVTDQVRVALAGLGRWGDEEDVVWRLDQDPGGVPAVRVAGQAASARRAIHEVPLAEVAAAARIVVERAVGIPTGDLVRDAARLLGFSRTTERVVERVAAGVQLAAQRALIRIDGDRATLPD